MLWNEGRNLKVEMLTMSEYSIHVLVKVPSQSHNFLLTAIYASPNFNKRKMLWEYLKILAPSVNLSWFLLGDFNEMLTKDEKMGGLPLNRNRIFAFRDCIDQCGMMDLGFYEPRFTWTNKNSIWYRNIKERLDRGLGNAEWKIHFPRMKFIIFLVLNLITAPYYWIPTPRNVNRLSLLNSSKCGSRTPPSHTL